MKGEKMGGDIGLALAVLIILAFTPPYLIKLGLSILENRKKEKNKIAKNG